VTGALLLGAAIASADATSLAAIPSRCHASQLIVRIGHERAAAGHIGVEVRFENVSARTCTLYGYPGLQMLGAADRPLPTEVHRGRAYTVPDVAQRLVTLHLRHSAAFDTGWDDATGYGLKQCPASTRVLITPPNAYQSISVPWRIRPYGGGSTQHLRCGEITVSPVFATTHAAA
jgi:hypothetical protein